MDNYTIVRPEHLNHHGYLFGGVMLKWVDEFAWLVVSRDFPGCRMVTLAMDQSLFKERVVSGAILRFCIEPRKKGQRSVMYEVVVHADEPGATVEKRVFSTRITFVRVSEDGKAQLLPESVRYRSLGEMAD